MLEKAWSSDVTQTENNSQQPESPMDRSAGAENGLLIGALISEILDAVR